MVKQMSKAERAEYMRDYRARKKREEVARAEIEVRVNPPVVDSPLDVVDVSTAAPVTHLLPPAKEWLVRRPSFLAAPDDDCGVCGHDRQSYHLGPICTMGVIRDGRRRLCECPAFVDSSEPF